MPFAIHDARSYYSLIKMNKLKSSVEDDEAVAALEDQLQARIKAANADGLTGSKRDSYMLFQGAVMGMLIESKKYAQHLRVQAEEQHIRLEGKDADSH